MWLAILTVAVSVTVNQGQYTPVSLSGCVNDSQTSNTTMVIDCAGVAVNSTILFEELDLLLSDEELRERLVSLTITNTPLTRVPASVCQLSNLIALNLDHNQLVRLPDNCFTAMTDLRQLSAKFNNVTALQDGLFDGLRSLESISLSSNRISAIGPGVFTEESDLINLTMVSLKNNLLTGLDPWPAILSVRRTPGRPLIVDLRSNRIAALTNTIGWRYNCTMPPSYCRLYLSHNRLTRLSDMINGWGLDDDDFLCLMRHSGGSPVFRFNIEHNPFICDCRDFRFYAISAQFVYSNIFRRVYCSEPAELFRMEIVRIQLIQYTCDLDDGCPSGCKCMYRPANATVHVGCPANNFTSLPVRLPPLPKSYARYKLDLSNNKPLRRLDHRPYLVNTSFLDVSHCSVEEIDSEAWRALVNVGTVFLNDNLIVKVPREYSLVNVTSGSISLERNPWDCSCDRSWMHDWFNSVSAHLSSPTGILCQSPPRLKGTSIIRMYKENFCVDPVKRAVTVSMLAFFGSLALFITLCVALVYCLRVCIHRRCNFHPFDRDECVGEDMDYDVFLSCSADDQDTHGRRLVDLMQSRGYRVFRPGASCVTDDTTSAVKRSRRTVCLLSKHFIKRFVRFHDAYRCVVCL